MAVEPRIELVARRSVCRNAVFEVFLDEIIDERGRRVSDYLSVVPIRADATGVTGVAVLPVRAGQVGLLRIFRHPQGSACWEIPKGFIEEGERPEAAAVRELKEESGLVASEDELLDLGYLSPVPGVIRGKVRLFAALDAVSSGDVTADELGHSQIEHFTIDTALAMARGVAIEEPCTLVAIYRYVDVQLRCRPDKA